MPTPETLRDVEAQLRALLLSPEPRLLPGLDEERQLLYRRLVRGNFFDAVRRAMPIARKLLGEDVTRALITRFLVESPPTTRFLREVPSEFAAWAQHQQDLPHAAARELIHWECLELDVTDAPEPERVAMPALPRDDATIATHPSARLAAYMHPVHRLTRESSEWPEARSEPFFLIAFRPREALDWISVAPVIAKMLVATADGSALLDAARSLEAQHGAPIDLAWVRANLIDLERRGALLGFPPASTSPPVNSA